MFDTELASCDLADRLDQLATELSVPLSTGGATQSAHDQTVAALLRATAQQLAREAAAELRRSHAEVQRLRQQLRQHRRNSRREWREGKRSPGPRAAGPRAEPQPGFSGLRARGPSEGTVPERLPQNPMLFQHDQVLRGSI